MTLSCLEFGWGATSVKRCPKGRGFWTFNTLLCSLFSFSYIANNLTENHNNYFNWRSDVFLFRNMKLFVISFQNNYLFLFLTFQVTCSYLQIYNERIFDLLNSNPKLEFRLREDPQHGMFRIIFYEYLYLGSFFLWQYSKCVDLNSPLAWTLLYLD